MEKTAGRHIHCSWECKMAQPSQLRPSQTTPKQKWLPWVFWVKVSLLIILLLININVDINNINVINEKLWKELLQLSCKNGRSHPGH